MKHRWLVIATFFSAILLDSVPWNNSIAQFWPDWTFLVLLFWVLKKEVSLDVGTAFISGLAVDLLKDELLGFNALIFITITYCIVKFSAKRIVAFSFIEYSVIFFIAIIFEKLGVLGLCVLLKIPYQFSALFKSLCIDYLLFFIIFLICDACYRYVDLKLKI